MVIHEVLEADEMADRVEYLSKPEGGRNMTTTREKQGFDCVKTTREIRDRLGVELAGMSPEDRVQWLNTRDFSDPLLRRLVNRRAATGRSRRRVRSGALDRQPRAPTRFRPYPARK